MRRASSRSKLPSESRTPDMIQRNTVEGLMGFVPRYGGKRRAAAARLRPLPLRISFVIVGSFILGLCAGEDASAQEYLAGMGLHMFASIMRMRNTGAYSARSAEARWKDPATTCYRATVAQPCGSSLERHGYDLLCLTFFPVNPIVESLDRTGHGRTAYRLAGLDLVYLGNLTI